MRITPKSPEQIAAEGLCPEGWWEASVEHAEETTSKNGNDMMKLRLLVYTSSGERTMFDYLLDAMAHKLRAFCEAAELLTRYEAGSLTDRDCVGKVVMVEVEHKTQSKGEYAGRVQAQVCNYRSMDRAAKPARTSAKLGDPIKDDDIPF